MRPVYLGRAPVAGRVLAAAYIDSSTMRAPWLSLPEPMALRHPQFFKDVRAFAADLRRTGNLEEGRADSIARVAVREAYHRRIPPALVLGVMLTENDQFKRNARSKVGAMGLMQIMPRVWMPNLGPILGRNLKDDETNLRYGVYILKHFAKRTADTLDAASVTQVALLRLQWLCAWEQHARLPGVSREGASPRERERARRSAPASTSTNAWRSRCGRRSVTRRPPPYPPVARAELRVSLLNRLDLRLGVLLHADLRALREDLQLQIDVVVR